MLNAVDSTDEEDRKLEIAGKYLDRLPTIPEGKLSDIHLDVKTESV